MMALGCRFGPDFDDHSDPTWMTTVFRWMIDWAADSHPNSMKTGLPCRWIIDSGWAGRRLGLAVNSEFFLISQSEAFGFGRSAI